jgi:ADP-ribose pyrophosphatase
VLEVFTVPWQQLLDLIRDGTITDVKTIVGTYWLERVLKQS